MRKRIERRGAKLASLKEVWYEIAVTKKEVVQLVMSVTRA